MERFRAFRIDQENDQIVAGFRDLSVDDLSPGEVVIKVSHSTINYKDALAATGAGKILRRYPLNGGIDLAGTVVSSDDDISAGSTVIVPTAGIVVTPIEGPVADQTCVGSSEYSQRRNKKCIFSQ